MEFDRIGSLPTIVVPDAAAFNNVRQDTTANNNVRTERYQLRVTGTVTPDAAATVARNRGSILSQLTTIGYSDGGTDILAIDARLARFLAECLAPSPLPARRITDVEVAAGAPVDLEEIVPLYMSAYKTGNPNETKYVEANKQMPQEPFITPVRNGLTITDNAGTTTTDLQATVEQVYDEMVSSAPFLQPYIRQIIQNIAGSNAALKVDLRGNRYVRGILIQQDSDEGEVSDIIETLVLRGDRTVIFGPNGIPFADLQQAQAYEYGGELPAGYLFIDFCRYGRLSAMWNPAQDTNLRLELGVVTGAGTNPIVRVAMVEYQRTPSTTSEIPFAI